jgi:ketosteroid isomerase-like protein
MKKVKNRAFFYLAIFLILCPAVVFAQDSKKQRDTLEQEIRKLDLAEAKAIQKRDFQALDKLSSKDFTTNSPRNEIVRGKEELKELIRKGVINYASFVREIEEVLIYEKTAVIMGREIIVTNEAVPQTIRRRYTNVWMKRNGKWLLTARHANIICQ